MISLESITSDHSDGPTVTGNSALSNRCHSLRRCPTTEAWDCVPGASPRVRHAAAEASAGRAGSSMGQEGTRHIARWTMVWFARWAGPFTPSRAHAPLSRAWARSVPRFAMVWLASRVVCGGSRRPRRSGAPKVVDR